jgi:hypothetical protein
MPLSGRESYHFAAKSGVIGMRDPCGDALETIDGSFVN